MDKKKLEKTFSLEEIFDMLTDDRKNLYALERQVSLSYFSPFSQVEIWEIARLVNELLDDVERERKRIEREIENKKTTSN